MECSTRKHSLLSPVAANRKSGLGRWVAPGASTATHGAVFFFFFFGGGYGQRDILGVPSPENPSTS